MVGGRNFPRTLGFYRFQGSPGDRRDQCGYPNVPNNLARQEAEPGGGVQNTCVSI
jgi:hypothetical protein